ICRCGLFGALNCSSDQPFQYFGQRLQKVGALTNVGYSFRNRIAWKSKKAFDDFFRREDNFILPNLVLPMNATCFQHDAWAWRRLKSMNDDGRRVGKWFVLDVSLWGLIIGAWPTF